MDRRSFFRTSSVLGLSAWATQTAFARNVVTPPQTEGPFYPVKDQLDKDVDLTWVEGKSEPAIGADKAILVRGIVTSGDGKPLSGVFVDVWQACKSGKYDHKLDENPAPLDPNFQYWARFATDSKGEFRIKTIIPGAYPATPTWIRPPHLHFRFDAFGHGRLTTQMYFKGEALNAKDDILLDTLKKYGQAAHDSLIVDFSKEKTADGIPVGTFKIVLGAGARGTPHVD